MDDQKRITPETDIRGELVRYPKTRPRQKRPEHQFDFVLIFISLIIAISIGYALHAVLPSGGIERTLQVLFGGAAAGLLSYIGNKLSIHKGALLAARDDGAAIIAVTTWFLSFGLMVGTLSFTGLSYKIVRDASLRSPVQEIEKLSRDVNRISIVAKQVSPILQSGKTDIDGVIRCEIEAGCVSGKRGTGPEVAKLQQIVGKFDGILRQFQVADRNRARLASTLNGLARQYEKTLNASGTSWGEKRSELLAVYSRAQRVAIEIENVIPTSAAKALVGDLRNLSVAPAKPGRIDLAEKLRAHANGLENALGDGSKRSVALPPFPPPPGIAAGWQRFDLTWPLAIFAYLLEFVVLFVWFIVYRQYLAIQDWLNLEGPHPHDDPGDHVNLVTYDPDPDPEPRDDQGGRGAAKPKTKLESDAIDGPNGWSGRSRFNATKLKQKDVEVGHDD